MVYYLTRLVQWLAGRIPRPVRLALGGPVTVLVYYAWRAKRRVTIENMAQILGTSSRDPRARTLARRSWRNYGRYLSDFFYLPNATHQEILDRTRDVSPGLGAFSLVDEARAAGKGALLVSLHFGAWDVAGVVLTSHTPVHILVESFEDPRMDRLVMEQRRKVGLEILRIEKTPRQILRVLQQNGVVGVAIDRPLPAGEGVPVRFFGRTCWVPGGIAQLALRSGAAVVPGYCRYDPEYSETYYIGAGPVIFPERTGNKEADTQALMQRMFDALEPVVRAYPEQWEMFRAFWQGAPETESASLLSGDAARELESAPTVSPSAVASDGTAAHESR